MSTREKLDHLVDDFERDYPDDSPQSLAWYVDRLRVRPESLLRLLGLPADEVCRLGETRPVDWADAIRLAGEEAAYFVEDILERALARSHYDWETLREEIRRAPEREIEIPLLGNKAIVINQLPPDERDAALLQLIAQGSPAWKQALLTYLAHSLANPAHS
jgi:hypothetical protein